MQRRHRRQPDRQHSLNRRRRIILNNDGGDATQGADPGTADPLDFLEVRTTPLAGSQVDTVSYCTSRGFGMFIHATQVGQTVPNPAIAGMISRGTDPLAAMVDYGHAHHMEIFWSMRMNDTHDGTRPEAFQVNAFKVDNPDRLLGESGKRPRYGQWSAVDYGHPAVRSMATAVVEEVCRHYAVDGIELDFFRHPVFFRSTATGEPASQTQRQQMTEVIREIDAIIRREGDRRGRPFLLAVRTPDDVDYAATIGLDLEGWMQAGLVDIYIPSAYFRLRSWSHSVHLGRRYDVRVYPGLSETRVGGGHHADRARASDECYRARAANAWRAGADGIYLFNLFDPRRRIWNEIGSAETLNGKDKVYFASVRGVGRAAGGAYPHQPFIRIPTLNPGAPLALPPDGRQVVRLDMAEGDAGSTCGGGGEDGARGDAYAGGRDGAGDGGGDGGGGGGGGGGVGGGGAVSADGLGGGGGGGGGGGVSADSGGGNAGGGGADQASETERPIMSLVLTEEAAAAGSPTRGDGSGLVVVFNGSVLTEDRDGTQAAPGVWRYHLDPAVTRTGWNTIEIYHSGAGADRQLLDLMVAVDYTGCLLSDTDYLHSTRQNM